MILYVNACSRNNSRTDFLAKKLLQKLGKYEEVNLDTEKLFPMTKEKLNYRSELAKKGDFSDSIFDYAKQFMNANQIVISAPYWDSSFPAILKLYIENIYVVGLITNFDNTGKPQGKCKATNLYYVTTAGGKYNPSFSFDYITDVTTNYFGVQKTTLIMAENLDIEGYDATKILEECIKKYNL